MEDVSKKNHELTSEGKIHVMPAAFRNVKETRKIETEKAAASVEKGTGSDKVAVKKKAITPLRIIIGIILVALVGGSVYLLYLSTQPIETTTPFVPPPVIVETPEQPEVLPETAESPVEEVVPQEPFKPEKLNEELLVEATSADSDNDGLTDLEEIVFSTNPNKSDSDKDGYEDGTEVLNLYNPQGTAPVKLEFTNFIKIYSNGGLKSLFFYPESWLVAPGAVNDNEVILTSEKGDFINVFTVKKDTNQKLSDWYLEMVPTLTLDEIVKFTGNKYEMGGIVSPDGFTYFFEKNDLIYVVHYNMGKDLEVNYPTVLRMIANSFHFSE